MRTGEASWIVRDNRLEAVQYVLLGQVAQKCDVECSIKHRRIPRTHLRLIALREDQEEANIRRCYIRERSEIQIFLSFHILESSIEVSPPNHFCQSLNHKRVLLTRVPTHGRGWRELGLGHDWNFLEAISPATHQVIKMTLGSEL